MDALRVPVHYDFASTICYVAHRVMQRMTPALDELGIELCWTPLDLATLCGYPREEPLPDLSRARDELARRTEEAAREQVTGVPTFMLGSWPFGGIQQEDTMRHVLARFARKAREERLA